MGGGKQKLLDVLHNLRGGVLLQEVAGILDFVGSGVWIESLPEAQDRWREDGVLHTPDEQDGDGGKLWEGRLDAGHLGVGRICFAHGYIASPAEQSQARGGRRKGGAIRIHDSWRQIFGMQGCAKQRRFQVTIAFQDKLVAPGRADHFEQAGEWSARPGGEGPGVSNHEPLDQMGMASREAKTDWTTPIMDDQRDIMQIQMKEQGFEVGNVVMKSVWIRL